MKISWYNRKWGKISLHVAAWLIVLSLPYLLRVTPGNDPRPQAERNAFFILSTLTNLCWIVVFYFNLYIFTPRFLFLKRYAAYTAFQVGIFAVVMLIHASLFRSLTQRNFILGNSIGFNLVPFILALAVSTVIGMIQDRNKTDKLLVEKHEENMKTELSFLRSQISPHFLFNVLNNMLALARLKSDELEPTIFKLSSLMRYMLYEAAEEKVLLKKEIAYLQSYIDLQQQRLGSKVKVQVMMSQSADHYEIAPMLLIPFIENAFKHGVGNIEHPQIDIDLYTKDDILHFMVRNKRNSDVPEEKDKTSGIGLVNVKRRLDLLYGSNHNLLIAAKHDCFTVSLQLNLV
ncbi:histidine kinase [Panacibacter sp. DH6]|uniref:Histidine kinase n=1 Tax=Panacibacter microcysteis TaxID=2793269 RepID=A0A931GW24_9BACT|nr:histidine kinase [Panacibacter microcysteis]MBG9377095.1 histidine kinase [Panacibacter microcysteis]